MTYFSRSLSIRFTSALLISLMLVSCSRAVIRPLPQARHAQTTWIVQASLPLDALAFMNVLTGDELAAGHYFREASKFPFEDNPEVNQAVQRLADFRVGTLHSNLSGFLYPWFTIGNPQNLDDLIRLAGAPETLRQAMIEYDESNVEMNVYYHEDAWKNFRQVAPDVRIVLSFMKDQGFDVYWNETLRPRLEADLTRIRSAVEPHNVIPEVESVVGFGLPSGEVTVSLVYFEWPYGHHILGTHFSTIPEDNGVIRSTTHELLHHPFNNTDPAFWKTANSLKKDALLMAAFDNRDPKYGYNDWPYYVAENSVRALEQIIEVKMGLGERWTWQEDGGMHLLAACLYQLMQQESFPQNGESYQAFFIRMVDAGKLQEIARGSSQ